MILTELAMKTRITTQHKYYHHVILPKAEDHLKLVVSDIILERDVDVLETVDC